MPKSLKLGVESWLRLAIHVREKDETRHATTRFVDCRFLNALPRAHVFTRGSDLENQKCFLRVVAWSVMQAASLDRSP